MSDMRKARQARRPRHSRPALTLKQVSFCREYVKDCNGTQAAIRAGYSDRTAKEQATRLLTKVPVKSEIDRLQAALATDAKVTVQSLLREAEEARSIASGAGQASAMVSASLLKAKLCGLLIEKTEDVVARDMLAAREAQQQELRTAGELLAEAAASLGLPRTATPAQIVGAIASHPLATPEAFTLLRASRTAIADKKLL